MNADQMQIICEKLGTTIDNLLPSVIAYGKHSCTVSFVLCGIITFLCIVLAIFGYAKVNSDYCDASDWYILLIIISIVIGVVCFAVTCCTLCELHMWNKFPEIQAYHSILNWLN